METFRTIIGILALASAAVRGPLAPYLGMRQDRAGSAVHAAAGLWLLAVPG